MVSPSLFKYDAFVSYSHLDEKWVREWLVARLEDSSLRICIDYRDFRPGAPSVTEIERAIAQSKKTLVILTPQYINSKWAEFENALVQSLDPNAEQRRLIPVFLEKCELPPRIQYLTYLDFTKSGESDLLLNRLVRAIESDEDSKAASRIGEQSTKQRPDAPDSLPEREERSKNGHTTVGKSPASPANSPGMFRYRLWIAILFIVIIASIGILLLATVGRELSAAFLDTLSWRAQQLAGPINTPTISEAGGEPPMLASVKNIIPTQWNILTDQIRQCDVDLDGDDELLLFYTYDSAGLPPQIEEGEAVTQGFIGGVVYDVQKAPPAIGQRQAMMYVQYALLPDLALSKGQGYLGDTSVTVSLYPPQSGNDYCQASEIIVQGFSGSRYPTRLSIFRWEGESVGYSAAHFVGNVRVESSSPTEPITEVSTYNRLNDRSALCDVEYFSRPPVAGKGLSPPQLKFTRVDSTRTLDFCYGAPGDPTYPEGTVAALLRGNVPRAANDKTKMPPGNSFLLPGVSLPPGLAPPVSILALTNTASAVPVPGGGHLCVAEYGDAGRGWWCGQLEVVLTSEVPVNGGVREVAWKMISVSLEDVADEVHWRISHVEVR